MNALSIEEPVENLIALEPQMGEWQINKANELGARWRALHPRAGDENPLAAKAHSEPTQ